MTTTYWVPTIGNALPPLGASQGGTGSATPVPWMPSDDLALGANLDPAAASGGGLLVGGTLYLARLAIRSPVTVTNLLFCLTTVGVGASTGSFVGLLGPTGTLLSGSADIGATLTGAPGWKTVPLSTPQAVAGGGVAWAVILCNLATTQPTLLRALNTTNSSIQGGTPASFRYAQQAAFGTALTNVNLASNALSGFSNVFLWS